MRNMVEYMAGNFSSEISCASDFVIASDVLHPKYQVPRPRKPFPHLPPLPQVWKTTFVSRSPVGDSEGHSGRASHLDLQVLA